MRLIQRNGLLSVIRAMNTKDDALRGRLKEAIKGKSI